MRQTEYTYVGVIYIMQVASLVPVTTLPLCLHESGTRQLPVQKSGELLPALWNLC